LPSHKDLKKIVAPPPKERGLRKTGFTIAGYPFAYFGLSTILHAKRVELVRGIWKEEDIDCGGIMKLTKIWVNDVPNGYEVVLGMGCQECGYTDSIRLPYSGHKQLFNNTSHRTWRLSEGGVH